jgi:hypothetical protein
MFTLFSKQSIRLLLILDNIRFFNVGQFPEYLNLSMKKGLWYFSWWFLFPLFHLSSTQTCNWKSSSHFLLNWIQTHYEALFSTQLKLLVIASTHRCKAFQKWLMVIAEFKLCRVPINVCSKKCGTPFSKQSIRTFINIYGYYIRI